MAVIICTTLLFIIFDRIIYNLLTVYTKNWYTAKFSKTVETNLKKSVKADLIVMGTSRARNAINPGLLGKLRKCTVRIEAAAGRNIRYHYNFYKLYRKYFPAPEIVLYGCDYFMFNARSRIDELTAAGILTEKNGIKIVDSEENISNRLLGKISYLYKFKPQFDNFTCKLY